MTVHVYGPADVTEIDPRQVIRAFPKADVVNAEVDDLAHVEFDRPDLPWLFTPAGPDAAGHLVPWITLVVAERRHVDWGEWRGKVRAARIRRDQLQPLGDAWAWAHAQVMGAKGATPEAEPTLERRLSESNAAHNLSRLVCPRRLDDRTAYVACVVPTFLAGVQAGLGLDAVATLAPAWGTPDEFRGRRSASTWSRCRSTSRGSFGTAEEGNFESLARKLRPAIAPPGVGRRRVDATHAVARIWRSTRTIPAPRSSSTGPVVSPQSPETEPPGAVADRGAASTGIAGGDRDARRASSIAPDAQAHAAESGPAGRRPAAVRRHARTPAAHRDAGAGRRSAAAVVPRAQPRSAPPHRGRSRHARRAGRAGGPDARRLEPGDRRRGRQSRAATGAAREARRRVAASAPSVAPHRWRGGRRSPSASTPRFSTSQQRSVWASIEASSLPASVTTGAFRRLTRPRGPLVRAAVAAAGATSRTAVDMLTVRDDRLTTDWVRTYQSPDGDSRHQRHRGGTHHG